MPPTAMIHLRATTSASPRGCFVAPRPARDSPRPIFRRVQPPVRKSARSFSGRRAPAARASAAREGSHPDDELEVFGFTEQWEVDMVRFWRDWNDATERHRVRELDIKWLVALGRTDDSFSRVDVVSAGARKLATLLPDANVPNMFQREPAIIHFNFVRASQSILELQEVLCDVDKCTDVTPVLERHPRLLLCEDVRAEVEAAKARLHELAPKCDAAKAVNEYPELIYRIHQYDEYAELPISIQNIIMETSSEDISERIDEYNARWDDWEREAGAGEGAFGDAAGLDETSWRNDRGGFDAPDAQEWMLDGYYDEDDD